MVVQDLAMRTEAEKGTGSVQDLAMRTEAEKDEVAGGVKRHIAPMNVSFDI